MSAHRYTIVSCLVALLALASCGAGTGSPLQSLEATEDITMIGEAVSMDHPSDTHADSKSASFATSVIYSMGGGYSYMIPSDMYRYRGSVNEYFVPGLPHLGMVMTSSAGTKTRVYYAFKGLGPIKLQKLNVRANATDLKVGLWYKTAAEPAWGIASAQYDWFAPATFPTGRNFYLNSLPHHASSVYGAGFSIVVFEVEGGDLAWLQNMHCWAF